MCPAVGDSVRCRTTSYRAGGGHLGQVDRLLDYASPEDTGYLAFLRANSFIRLTTTTRGWKH